MLRVLNNEANNANVQDCSRCRLASHCWRVNDLSHQQIATNLLVCRIKLGVNVEESWDALFELYAHKIYKIAKIVRKGDLYNTPVDEYVAEIKAVMISAINDYQMGDKTHPAAWLFQLHVGAVERWKRAMYQRRDVRRKHATVLIGATPGQMDEENAVYDAIHAGNASAIEDTDEEEERSETYAAVINVIQDGHTLTTAEYRVARMALDHQMRSLRDDSDYIRRATGLSPRGLSLQLSALSRKIASRSGQLDAIAAKLGVTVEEETRKHRAARLHGISTPLTDAERQQILKVRGRDRDLALVYGVDPKTIWSLRKQKASRA